MKTLLLGLSLLSIFSAFSDTLSLKDHMESLNVYRDQYEHALKLGLLEESNIQNRTDSALQFARNAVNKSTEEYKKKLIEFFSTKEYTY